MSPDGASQRRTAARLEPAAPVPDGTAVVVPNDARQPLPAFAGVGLELEYAIVDRTTLDVRPHAEALLAALAGTPASDVVRGAIGWSNELVAHVIELKNVAPVATLADVPAAFQAAVREANDRLAARDAMLMPTGMHPWMDPRAETVLWSRDGTEIYTAFDRIFDCRRHGWANLQSMHVNLPFAGDVEFARLHAAVRALLPLVPALAASSPLADGQHQRELDHRLEVYRTHADTIPEVVGGMIPAPVTSRLDYDQRVLEPMYRAIASRDPERTLQHEWLNARGAIARFDRSAIEIRLCDTQECPRADIAIAAAIVSVARALFEERWARYEAQRALTTAALAAALRACMRDAERARIDDAALCKVLGVPCPCSAGEAWASLIERCDDSIAALDPDAASVLRLILAEGPLARRILAVLQGRTGRAALREVYERLCVCLAGGALFSVA